MGRYDRNRNKKANYTPLFVVAILIALFIGIGGSYYLMTKYGGGEQTEAMALGTATTRETAVPELYTEEQMLEDEVLLETPVIEQSTAQGINPLAASLNAGLPSLLDSDNLIRQLLGTLSPGLSPWLNPDQLLRKFMVIINDFAQGFRVSNHMSFLGLDEAFSVGQGENGLYVSEKSYHRYDKLAQAIQAIDAKAAAVIYQKIRPLMAQVFAEFSYPKDITLEAIVKKAMAEILAAPVLEGQIGVIRPSVYYKFADPTLEALSPVQKQMLRMGVENTRIIQAKGREFLVALAKTEFE